MAKKIQPTAFLLDSACGYCIDKSLKGKEKKRQEKRLVKLAKARSNYLKELRKMRLYHD